MSADDMIRRGDAIAVCRHAADAERAADHIETIPAVAPKVRPLKFGQVYAEFYAAETPFGAYEVFGDYWRSPFSKKTEQSADPVAAAQADFDARILAALDLTPATDLDRLIKDAERRGQIKAGAIFANYGTNEADYAEAVQNACPYCNGSGHKDDVTPAPDARVSWVLERCDDGSTTRVDWITGGGDAEGEFARIGLVREWEDGRVEYRTYSAHGAWGDEPRLMKPAPDAAAIREAAQRHRDEVQRLLLDVIPAEKAKVAALEWFAEISAEKALAAYARAHAPVVEAE